MSISLPDPPDNYGTDPGAKAKYDAEVAILGKHAEHVDAIFKADIDSDISLYEKYHEALLAVAKDSIERSRSSADLLQKAAAAIATIYVGILGVSFSVADRPMPSRGAVPAVFLGLAISLSTVYLAYLTRPAPVTEPPSPTSTREGAKLRARTFISWITSGVENRGIWLRRAVVALGIGVALLPAPFVALKSNTLATDSQPTLASWPTPPDDVSNPSLHRILYAAQVEETAELRKAQSAPANDDGNDSAWWAVAVLGLLVVWRVPPKVGADPNTAAPAASLPLPLDRGRLVETTRE